MPQCCLQQLNPNLAPNPAISTHLGVPPLWLSLCQTLCSLQCQLWQLNPDPTPKNVTLSINLLSTNPVDGAACDSMDDDSDDFFIVSHVHGSILEKSDTSSGSFVPKTSMMKTVRALSHSSKSVVPKTPMMKTVRALSHSSESFVPETPMRRIETTPSFHTNV